MSSRPSTDLNADGALGAALRALPLEAPAASAWPDLERALRATGVAAAPVSRRRYVLPAALAAALALFLAWPVLVRTPVETGAAPGTATLTASAPTQTFDRLRDESQRIESWLRKVAASGAPIDGQDLMAATEIEDLIGLIDLQLAGSDAADGATLALWRQRVDLLRDLAVIRTNAYSPAETGVAANGTAAAPDTWIN